MAVDNFFLERETERYHLVAVGEDKESAFVTFKSKSSGLAFFHVSARHSDVYSDEDGLDWWIDFLDKAESLNGDALDEHLMRFFPISHLDATSVPGLQPYSSPRDPGMSGSSMITLATMLDGGVVTNSWDLKKLGDPVKAIFDRHLDRHRNDSKFAHSQTLVSALIDMDASIRQYGERAFRYEYIIEQMSRGGALFESGVLNELESTEEKIAIHRFISALHDSRLSRHQEGRREIEISSAAMMPSLPLGHPYHEAVKTMVMGDDCLIDRGELDNTGWFGGETHQGDAYPSPGNPHSAVSSSNLTGFNGMKKGGGVHAMALLLRRKDQTEKRNLFQSFRAVDFQTGALSITEKEVADKFCSGDSSSKLLWDKLAQNTLSKAQYYNLDREKFGKRDTAVLINNLKALNKIAWWGEKGEIKTLSGEKLTIEPYSREYLMSGNSIFDLDPGTKRLEVASSIDKRTCQYSKITMENKEGDIAFQGNYDFNFSHVKGLSDLDDISVAFNLMNMPEGTLTTLAHMEVIRSLVVNPSLKSSMAEGGILLRDKKISKSDIFNGPWKSMSHIVSKEVSANPSIADSSFLIRSHMGESKSLQHYDHAGFVYDTENILAKVINAVKVSYLVDPESKYSCIEDILEDSEQETYEIILSGETFTLNEIDAVSPHKDLFYNAKLDLSRRAHSGYSALKKAAAPDNGLSWREAMPAIEIDVPGQAPVIIKNLASYREINNEGSEMNHCLSSYAERCMRGEYLAFSVTQEGKKIATLGMEADGEDAAEFDQLQGYGNKEINVDIYRAVMSQFVTPLEEEGEVKGYQLEIDNSDVMSSRLTRSELLAIQMDFDVGSEEKMAICRDYLANLIGGEAIVEMVSRELDSQIDHLNEIDQDVYDIDMDDEGTNFTYERNEIEKSRLKLYEDFGISLKRDNSEACMSQ